MIKIPIDIFKLKAFETSKDPPSDYVDFLDILQVWASSLGLSYRKAGSSIRELSQGEWCIQSYNPDDLSEKWPSRKVCFSEHDRKAAMLFKLRWGGV